MFQHVKTQCSFKSKSRAPVIIKGIKMKISGSWGWSALEKYPVLFLIPRCYSPFLHIPLCAMASLLHRVSSSCSVSHCYVRNIFPIAPIICSLVSSLWERSLQGKQQSSFLRDNVCLMGAENAPRCPQGLVSWMSWPWSLWDQTSHKSGKRRETLGLSRCHLRVAQELGSSLAGGLRSFHKPASNT